MRMKSRSSIATFFVCFGLIAAPAFSYAVGVRNENIENRSLNEFTGLSEGWETLNSLGDYLKDRNPLRQYAVRFDANIDRDFFSEDPVFGGQENPRVLEGKDKTLFLSDAIDNACAPHDSPENSVRQLSKLAKQLVAIGKKPLVMVAPDKSSLHADLLPFDADEKACFFDYIGRLNSSLSRSEIPGFVDISTLLSVEIEKTREFLYLKKDSHWDGAGSLVAVNAAIDYLSPGLRKKSDVRFDGTYEYTGDLTGMRGLPETDFAPVYRIDRGGEILLKANEVFPGYESQLNQRIIQTSDTLKFVPGRTLFLCDSYGLAALPQLTPYFEDLTIFLLANFDPEVFKDLVKNADTVWIMTVERGVSWRLKNEIGSDTFINSLELGN
jgi:alginate O-acetyltransferase complex protein AlgJ